MGDGHVWPALKIKAFVLGIFIASLLWGVLRVAVEDPFATGVFFINPPQVLAASLPV